MEKSSQKREQIDIRKEVTENQKNEIRMKGKKKENERKRNG